MKQSLGLGLVMMLIWASSLVGAQAQDAPRVRENFCEDWQFHLGDVPGAEQSQHDDAAWRTLNVPHDWEYRTKTRPESAGRHVGGLSPRRDWMVPQELHDAQRGGGQAGLHRF